MYRITTMFFAALKGGNPMQHIARYNKVWQHIATQKIYTDKLELKKNEKIENYRQIPKPKEIKLSTRNRKQEKPLYSFTETEKNDKGVF